MYYYKLTLRNGDCYYIKDKEANINNFMQTIARNDNWRDFLLASNKTLSYADYIPITRFTFDTILENPLAQVDSYMQTKKNIKNASVNNFTSSSDVLTEQVVNAYLAELTPRGKYLDAIAQVPQSFREGTRRTQKKG